ncbi:MAG: tRNA lysidine(34) synthetase TilS [Holosporales bacterium]|jgi:tRNA(Ile)-lysidine synthase|nr:tRNA lysidine(34) synthetase TilS [Holosporales bacterium]
MVISSDLFAENIPEVAAEEKKWVVAVSGGADSLCLTLLANEFAKSLGIHLFACFVDHKLRPESAAEIEVSISTLRECGNIDCHILIWQHCCANNAGNLEMKARKARYDLLFNFCQETSTNVLMTAHHSLDQWETFFMRLSRGSAIRGLSCIKPISMRGKINVIRPLLNFSPLEIRETLRLRYGITEYIQDPMNDQQRFERVRWRKAYPRMESEYGLDVITINRSIDRLRQVEECLDQLANNLIEEIFDGKYIDLQKLSKQHLEIRMRILEIIINRPMVSYSLLRRTALQICQNDFKATNLGGMVIKRDKTKNLKIQPEKRKRG